MKINKIEKLENNKYKINIDDESIITFDNVIIDNNLLYKTQIDKDLFDKIIKETLYYEIYNTVFKYILKKRRSLNEIKEFLIKFDLSEQEKNKMLSKLIDSNLINDEQYCKAFINDSLYLGKKGINKIKKELIEKGICLETIEKQLSYVNKDLLNDNLNKIIIKKIKLNKKYSNSYLKQKVLNELLSLGYDKENILNIIDNNLTNDYPVMKTEFEKTYTKYSKKYSNYELINKIKNKMVQKGFNINEINQLLQEKTEE